jgi:hypothetical protein
MLRGKFIPMSAYLKNTERCQINDLIVHLKLLKKQEHTKPKISKRRDIIKLRAKINKTEIPPSKKNTKNQQNKKLFL